MHSKNILEGNLLDILPTLPDNSFDAVLCDPPYHLTQNSRGDCPRRKIIGHRDRRMATVQHKVTTMQNMVLALDRNRRYRFLVVLLLALPTISAAKPMYTLSGYGAADRYAFSSMVRPEFGLAMKYPIGNRFYLGMHWRIAARNADPNGGTANIASFYVGDTFWRGHLLGMPIETSVYTGYQHLWYGPLHNNALGGGLRFQTRLAGLTLTAKVAALYGLSGNIGWHLHYPGNDYVFYGRAAYPIGKNISAFVFIRQERYIGNGNALTAQDTGMGLRWNFS